MFVRLLRFRFFLSRVLAESKAFRIIECDLNIVACDWREDFFEKILAPMLHLRNIFASAILR